MSTPANGARALVAALEELQVEVCFGIPGGAVLPLYDPLFDSSIRHVLVRHEQGAGHAAEGYAHATGRVGVCIATSGPGATNLVTPIADAHMDSVPIVAITGQVPSHALGTDAFQEADIVGITMPITKHGFLVRDASEIRSTIHDAFALATTGRPGPVLVDIPKDVLQAAVDLGAPFTPRPPVPLATPSDALLDDAAQMIVEAQRPVLYVGGGVVKANASRELFALAAATGAPVVTTLMARGAFPDTHPQHLGMPGMHGSVAAVTALQRADLLITLGARFDDRVTGHLDSFARGAKVIHLDVDPAEIDKLRHADVGLVGDARSVIAGLAVRVEALHDAGSVTDLTPWWEQCASWRERFPLGWEHGDPHTLAPQHVISRLGELVGPDAIYATGVGQHQMWAAQFLSHVHPRHFLTSGGLGTMGYAVPAAMGAKVGRPDATVWAIDGDGCFQMTNQELVTCAVENIPIKVAVINNGNLGMVRQWQTLFYDSRYSNTGLHSKRIPDFVGLAESMGARGLRCEDPALLDATIEEAQAIDDQPVVVDFVVGEDAMVWPMVTAGTSNDDIAVARSLRPVWDATDV